MLTPETMCPASYEKLRDGLVMLMHSASLKSVPEQHALPSIPAVLQLLNMGPDEDAHKDFCFEPWQDETSQKTTGQTIEESMSTYLGVCPVSDPVNTIDAIEANNWHVPGPFVALGAKNDSAALAFFHEILS